MPLLIAKLNTRWSSSSICSSYPQSSWLPQAHVPIPIGDTVNGPTFTCTHTNVPPGWTWVILNNGFFLLGFWNFFGKIWKSRGYQKHPKLRKQQGLQQATEERERERERERFTESHWRPRPRERRRGAGDRRDSDGSSALGRIDGAAAIITTTDCTIAMSFCNTQNPTKKNTHTLELLCIPELLQVSFYFCCWEID